MATTETGVRGKGEAGEEAAAIDRELLEQTARQFYIDLSHGRMRGYDPRVVAERAYMEAKAFVEVTVEFRNGKAIPTPRPADPQLFVLVQLWDGGKGQFGEPKLDENGQPITEAQPVDRYSFAPNLPAEHPVNQRYIGNACKHKRFCDRTGKPLGEKDVAVLVAREKQLCGLN